MDDSSETVPLRFVTGSVEKIRRELRLDRYVDVEGKKQTITYRIPDGTSLNQIKSYVDDYLSDQSSKILFACQGQDCGRSTVWANDIFRQPLLVAPNKDQLYWSAVVQPNAASTLLSVYVVKRGNRRLYLHLEIISGVEELSNVDVSIVDKLMRRGYVVLEGILPNVFGNISSRELETIESLVVGLDSVSPLYVVCHLYGSDDVSTLITRSQSCAETVAERIRLEGVEVKVFSAGPMAPRDGRPISRVELIAPQFLRSD